MKLIKTNFKLIILSYVLLIISSNTFAQKKEYLSDRLDLVYDKALLKARTGLTIGEDKVVKHACTAKIIIDEGNNTITGNIRFTCSECAVENYNKPINLIIYKITDGFYRVTSFVDTNKKCDDCIVRVNEETGDVTFNFLYFNLLEQKTVFHTD